MAVCNVEVSQWGGLLQLGVQEPERGGGGGVVEACALPAVRDGKVGLDVLQEWLEARVGQGLGDPGIAVEVLVDELLHEMSIAVLWKDSAGLGDHFGCVREGADQEDAEDEAVRTAEKLVYGCLSERRI